MLNLGLFPQLPSSSLILNVEVGIISFNCASIVRNCATVIFNQIDPLSEILQGSWGSPIAILETELCLISYASTVLALFSVALNTLQRYRVLDFRASPTLRCLTPKIQN